MLLQLMAAALKNIFLLSFSCFLLLPRTCHSLTLVQGDSVSDDVQLKSSNGIFALGFNKFSQVDSPPFYSYLGIQYTYDDRGPVCVANRNTPISDQSGKLIIDKNGSLKIVHSGGEIILYEVAKASKTIATLEDSGNFVLYELNPDDSKKQVLWESFDYPTDTFLPGMKLGIDLRTGLNRSITSWRSSESAAPGSFTLGMDPNFTNQLVIWWQGEIYWSSGAWRNGYFDTPDSPFNGIYNFSYVSNENETYFNYSVNKAISLYPMLKLDDEGTLLGFRNNTYNTEVNCHFFFAGITSGCTHHKLPDCRSPKDVFKFTRRVGFMFDSGLKYSENENLSLVDCQAKCLKDCSCAAYAPTNSDGSGCETWSSVASFSTYSSDAHQRVIYFIDEPNKWWLWVTIAVGVAVVTPALVSFGYVLWKKFRTKGGINQKGLLNELGGNSAAKIHGEDGNELPIFSFDMIAAATNYFSGTNKLGEGGFGPVYKGRLFDGREIAIKRLSRSSGQGLMEFKNEALLIAKLQHTNLVRLLGFYIQKEEKMLIYEYMRNKSLDVFLFDSARKENLDWKKRFNIIEGIAQGLLYLHKYSRLRVIHRDLKASNILLDDEMNPKISDFGMARIFGMKESEANTNRVVGTYGYMSPEYAMSGIVSMKVDVFSFGVLILEIVSGKKNNGSYHPEHPLNLIGYVWQLWKENRGLEILDPTLQEFCAENVLRCIHVGLMCVQYHATDRPTMTDVVAMLSNETMALSEPKQPAFFVSEAGDDPDVQENKSDNHSLNFVSISVMEAR